MSRLPHEAGMTLLKKPFKPTSLPLAPVITTGHNVPSAWKNYDVLADGDCEARSA